MNQNFNIDPWIPCINCHAPMTVNNLLFDNYYFNIDIICPTCRKKIDFTSQLEKCIDLNFMNNNMFQLLGLSSKILRILIKPEERKTINFEVFGIPKGSRIVYINYTSQNGIGHPIQIHGNTPYIDLPQNEVTLYPLPFPNAEKKDLDVSIFIMWSEHKNTEIKYLIDGFHYYNIDKYDEMIIPLNIAIESYITNILFQHFENIWNTKVADRLIKKFEYSYILNSILDDLSDVNDWIKLSKDTRKDLINLLELRNQLAHSGKLKNPISKEDANQILKSVILAYHFCRIINQTINKKES